jgi:hypothetical protein
MAQEDAVVEAKVVVDNSSAAVLPADFQAAVIMPLPHVVAVVVTATHTAIVLTLELIVVPLVRITSPPQLLQT